MNNPNPKLPHLYHQPGTSGSGDSAGKIVAASEGVSPANWEEFLQLAPLLPPPDSYSQGCMGLYRGQTMDFILAHAYRNAAGKPGVHYVQLTADMVRQIAGRTRLLIDISQELPEEDQADEILPVEWAMPPAQSVDAHVDDLSDFTLMLHDNYKIISSLLAGLIQGIPVVITNGPHELQKQLAFVQGFLALLPAPARFGVTFSTFVESLDKTPVQIGFMATNNAPGSALAYDWTAGKLSGTMPEQDAYSRFIMQQLRLDPRVAVTQMVGLTRAAGWRLSQRESLSQSLGWAARRAAVDAAVIEGQPADSELVASILREDPTLTDDLRVRYVRHLLAFMLGLNNAQYAGIVGAQAHAFSDVEDAVLSMLSDAVKEGKAALVYGMIMRWMSQPDGLQGSAWRGQAFFAAEAILKAIVARKDANGVMKFFEKFQDAPDPLLISESMPRLMAYLLPFAYESAQMARVAFLLAVEHLPIAGFQRTMQDEDLVRQLPSGFQRALTHFQPHQQAGFPPGMLVSASSEFGEEWSLMVLARLLEWVQLLHRTDLIDGPALQSIAALARSSYRTRFQAALKRVVQDFASSDLLLSLGPSGLQHLVELALLQGEYRNTVGLLERINTSLFRGDAQADFAPWVSELFSRITLDASAMVTALQSIAMHGLKPLPLAMAYRGALLNLGFANGTEPIVLGLTRVLSDEPRLVPLVDYDLALRLVQFHSKNQDAENGLLLGAAVVQSLEGAESGLAIVGRLWGILNWDDEVREAAVELLRRYVRQVPVQQAVQIPQVVGRKLGPKIEAMLRATVLMSIVTGGQPFLRWTEDLSITVELLTDIMSGYVRKPYPTLHHLRSDLDTMSGGITEQERQEIAQDIFLMARQVYDLGTNRGKGRDRAGFEQKVITGKVAPRSGVDVLLWIGGNLADGQVIRTELERESIHHVLGPRSITQLIDELHVVLRTLDDLHQAFDSNMASGLTLDAFVTEVDSLWKSVGEYDQIRLQMDIASDAQTLALLLARIADEGDARALTDHNIGRGLELAKREPQTALEAMRLIYGYFMRYF